MRMRALSATARMLCAAPAAQLAIDSIDDDGRLILHPAAFWNRNLDATRLFCGVTGRYGIATREIITWLTAFIWERHAIEICAGVGDFAHHLHIPATDSKVQESGEFKATAMEMLGGNIPTPMYGQHVEQLDALAAVEKYRPEVVIGSWVTQKFDPQKDTHGKAQAFIHGVDEIALLDYDCVRAYIVIGNTDNHGKKRARRRPHEVLKGPQYGLVSRAAKPDRNCIFLWKK